MHKMYDELATWWPLLSPPEEYAEEAAFYEQILKDTRLPPEPTLLELGSGGGSNAVYLKKLFAQVTLADLSSKMLAVSETIHPDCIHVQGDMRTLRLAQEFDVVFIHDAIDYMTTADDLYRAITTAYIHCKPGGVALFVPDHVRETYEDATEHGGTDSDDGSGRGMRYLEWLYDPDENDTTCVVEYVYVLREGDQPLEVIHEQHVCGLFPQAEWERLLALAGFEVKVLEDAYERVLFVGQKS
ncbi:MAG: class I SAM-dependent methyltransferase [Chloroflexota bacterium]